MAFVPLIPLTPNLVNAPSQAGFVAAKGISELQSDWKPAPQQIRLASFPTPLAVLDATRLALEEPADTPHQSEFAQASELLLSGLVQGIYTLRWIALDDLDAPALRTSLSVAWREHAHRRRLGLIERAVVDTTGQRTAPEVVGVVVDDLVPAISARYLEQSTVNLGPLRQHLAQAGDRPDVVAALLRVVRDPLQRSEQWAPNRYRWMALVDRLIAKGKAPVDVDLSEDVRSAGPFYVPVTAPDGATEEERPLYLPCHAPGFAKRLAQALLMRQRTPADAGGRAGHVEFVAGGSAVPSAVFEMTTGRSIPPLDLGDGCAAWLDTSGPPPSPPQARQLLAADALKPGTEFERHVRLIQNQLIGVDDVVQNAPTRLTDLARVIALYAPELVGWSRAVDLSPRYDRWATAQRQGARPPKAHLVQAVSRGRAYILEPSTPQSNAAAAVFLEDAPLSGSEDKCEIGDLSALGLALWMAFCATPDAAGDWGARWGQLGPVNSTGGLLLDTKGEFVLIVPSALDAFFKDPTAIEATRRRSATLQRFLRAYSSQDAGLSGLFGLSARRFAHRVLGTEVSVDALLGPAAGSPPGPPFTLSTSQHGAASVFLDAFRSN